MTFTSTNVKVLRLSERTVNKFGLLELLVVFLKSILLLSHVSFANADQDIHGYKVLTLHARTTEDLQIIRQLQSYLGLDPWRELRHVNSSGDYLVSPKYLKELQEQLQNNSILYHTHIDDAERFFLDNDPLISRRRTKRSTSAHHFRHKFLSYSELRQFLKYIRNTAKKAKVEIGSIGRSFEGRQTPYIKISSINDSLRRRTIFIDGGIHGREWISPALTVEIIHRLVFNTEAEPDNLLELFDWIIVPLVNPDGYAYTFTQGFENRMWRKSRSTTYSEDPYCYGVDLNRNFGFHWNNSPLHGGSSNPCSGTFSGSKSFSEPESRNLREILLKNRNTIVAYLSFHSFGQFFLYPWGYSSDVDIEDEDDLLHVASAFSATMMAKNYEYSVGGSAKVLYPAAGGSDDYVRGTVGVKYAYTVELPPHETSRYGFLLPEYYVQSVVTDTWAGLKAFTLRLYRYLTSKGPRQTSRDNHSGNIVTVSVGSGHIYSKASAQNSSRTDNSTTELGKNGTFRRLPIKLSQSQSLWPSKPIWIFLRRIPAPFNGKVNNHIPQVSGRKKHSFIR